MWSVNAYAKVNLTLNILGPQPDGYHEIASLMALLNLHDTLTLETSSESPTSRETQAIPSRLHRSGRPYPTFHLQCDDSQLAALPLEKNLIYKAYLAFWDLLPVIPAQAFTVTLEKRIPMQAGLGGGSTDAAAMLLLLEAWFRKQLQRPLKASLLQQVAAQLGSDVPFFLLEQRVALVRGRGEVLRPIVDPLPKDDSLLLVQPLSTPIATEWAYREMRRQNSYQSRPQPYHWQAESLESLARGWYNDFAPVLIPQLPALQEVELKLRNLGAYKTLLCGSGSAMLGCFRTSPERGVILKQFAPEHYWCQLTHFSTEPLTVTEY